MQTAEHAHQLSQRGHRFLRQITGRMHRSCPSNLIIRRKVQRIRPWPFAVGFEPLAVLFAVLKMALQVVVFVHRVMVGLAALDH